MQPVCAGSSPILNWQHIAQELANVAAHTAERLPRQLCRQPTSAVHVECTVPGLRALCYHAPCYSGLAARVLQALRCCCRCPWHGGCNAEAPSLLAQDEVRSLEHPHRLHSLCHTVACCTSSNTVIFLSFQFATFLCWPVSLVDLQRLPDALQSGLTRQIDTTHPADMAPKLHFKPNPNSCACCAGGTMAGCTPCWRRQRMSACTC